jgi:D-aminoacyl-tRNA deacylase
MRAVVQRVSSAKVTVGERAVGEIGAGLVVLLGISPDDGAAEVEWITDKVVNLRVFSDESGKMNRSLIDIEGEAMIVSQFTLYGDARRGRRPSFVRAARGPEAERIYDEVVRALQRLDVRCATGEFGAMMKVGLVNDGPVTLLLDSEKAF